MRWTKPINRVSFRKLPSRFTSKISPLFLRNHSPIKSKFNKLSSSASSNSFSSSSSSQPVLSVGIVYGSFTQHATAIRDAWEIYEALNGAKVSNDSAILSVREPLSGDDFDIDSLDKNETDVLIVSTASQFGMPPQNFARFCQEMLLAARTNPGCLSHLHHAVWGAGDPRWFDTFMNVPRYVDQILGDGRLPDDDGESDNRGGFCGSTRLYARGEKGEPHLDEKECISAAVWASKMTRFAQWPTAAATATSVPWNALWETHNTPHHQMVGPITEEEIMKRNSYTYDSSKKPSKFADHDDQIYKNLLEQYCVDDAGIEELRKQARRSRQR